ncbi:MAG: hypothetical protein HVN35_09950 [Methanobacteriaceae archaeon]|nr:hypothetical protein [Methanobacteriaceae archaeon]
MNCKMEAKATVNPTEDMDKIIEALSNIFDYDDLIIGEDVVIVTGTTSSLFPLKESLEKQRIRDTALKIMLRGLDKENKKVRLKLNKQAAFASKINLVDENLSSLGEIELIIETNTPEKLINWLCDH